MQWPRSSWLQPLEIGLQQEKKKVMQSPGNHQFSLVSRRLSCKWIHLPGHWSWQIDGVFSPHKPEIWKYNSIFYREWCATVLLGWDSNFLDNICHIRSFIKKKFSPPTEKSLCSSQQLLLPTIRQPLPQIFVCYIALMLWKQQSYNSSHIKSDTESTSSSDCQIRN